MSLYHCDSYGDFLTQCKYRSKFWGLEVLLLASLHGWLLCDGKPFCLRYFQEKNVPIAVLLGERSFVTEHRGDLQLRSLVLSGQGKNLLYIQLAESLAVSGATVCFMGPRAMRLGKWQDEPAERQHTFALVALQRIFLVLML